MMFSILIPTRGRSEVLAGAVGSIWSTAAHPDHVEVVLRCDEDDPKTVTAARALRRSGPLEILVGPRLAGYRSLPVFFNDMAQRAHGDILMCGNDDMVFRTPGWDLRLRTVAEVYSDGIYDLGVDSRLNQWAFPLSIVSRRWVEAVGLLNDPRLLFSDIFLRDTADTFGRAIPVPEVVVEHRWVESGHMDQTRAEANVQEKALVFGDALNNWRPEYRALHVRVVRETVAKLRPHLDPTIPTRWSGRALYTRLAIEPPGRAGADPEAWPAFLDQWVAVPTVPGSRLRRRITVWSDHAARRLVDAAGNVERWCWRRALKHIK